MALPTRRGNEGSSRSSEVEAPASGFPRTVPLTVKLRGRPMHQAALQSNEALQAYPMRPSGRRGRTISSSARGAKPLAHHGPLERLLEVTLTTTTVRVRPGRRKRGKFPC